MIGHQSKIGDAVEMHQRREAVQGLEIKPAALKQQSGNATLSKAERSKSNPGEDLMLRFPRHPEATLAYLYCSMSSCGLRHLQKVRLVMVEKGNLVIGKLSKLLLFLAERLCWNPSHARWGKKTTRQRRK